MNDPDEYDYEAARREASELAAKEAIQRRLDRFNADRPPAFARPGDLHPDIAAWVGRFLSGATGGLILIGPTGVGKSWSLWKIKETLIKAGVPGTIEIKPVYQLRRMTTPPVDEAALDRLAASAVLAVDDFGSGRFSDWDADRLHALVDDRSAWQRPTILTTNIPDLRSALGERAASRLAERVTQVELTGPDRRRIA